MATTTKPKQQLQLPTTFRRRVGPAADMKELEYVSALHQTCMPYVRENGTVSSDDVRIFLKSRIGLKVSKEHARHLVNDLGGGTVSDTVIRTIMEKTQDPHDKVERARKRIREGIKEKQSFAVLRNRFRNNSNKGGISDNQQSRSSSSKKYHQQQQQKRSSSSIIAQSTPLMSGINAAASDEEPPQQQDPSVSAASPSPSESARANSTTNNNDDDDDEQDVVATSVPVEEDPQCDDVDAGADATATDNPQTSSSTTEYLDVVQIMAILLMPTLARAGKEWNDARLHPQEQVQEEEPPPTYEGLTGFIHKLYDNHKARVQAREDAFNNSLRPKPKNIISNVLDTMLKSVNNNQASSSSPPPVLDAELVRKLLNVHGEWERAADPVLVSKMVQAATTTSGLLDEQAFVKALTGDLDGWTVGAEDRNTSSFYDVWGYSNYYEKALLEVQQEQQTANDKQEEVDQQGITKDEEIDANAAAAGATSTGSAEKAADDFNITSTPTIAANLTEESEAVINVVKSAGSDGAYMVKSAGTGGANIVKAEMKQFKQRLSPIDDKHDSPEESETAKLDDVQPSASEVTTGYEVRPICDTTEEVNTDAATSSKNQDQKNNYKLDHARPLISIDSATDAFSSSVLYVGIFVFFICTALVYAVLFTQMPVFDFADTCADDFGCLLLDKIIVWAIFALFLSLCGYFVIIPLSIGNNPTERSPVLNVFAFFLSLVFTWMPYAAVNIYQDHYVDEPYNNPENTVRAPDYDNAQIVTSVIGCIVAAMLLLQVFLSLIGNRRISKAKWLSKVLLTTVASRSGRSKRAATRKINKLLENASAMTPPQKKNKSDDDEEKSNSLDVSEEVMINYVIRGESFDNVGGLFWTWKQFLTGALFEEEGIWIMSRLLVIQTIQLLFIGFKTYALTLFIKEAIRRCQQWQDNLPPDLPQWVYDFVPTPREASIALWPAFAIAVTVMVVLFFVYLPSYVRRVVQFRCGILPSLKSDVSFPQYRTAVDCVYTNIGNALYAMFGASLLFFFFFSLLIFLFIWPATKDVMLLFLAWSLGLAITISLKYVITSIWRYCYYAGFYRVEPKKANLTQLALECWYIGLGGGVLVSRFCQFILAACFFVGRTDVPFLSENVAMLGYIFDYAPLNFVRDILVHEAHHHPYIERLLAMYMMKLRDDGFGSSAGACWRQLFIASLMPWLVRHRVFSDERLGEFSDEYNTRRREGQSPLQISQQHATNEDDSPVGWEVLSKRESRRYSSHHYIEC